MSAVQGSENVKVEISSTGEVESDPGLTENEKDKLLLEEELKQLNDFISETKERIDFRNGMRAENVAAAENRPDESFFTKLDSNLKKTSAFIKKLKAITESQKDSLLKDIKTFNLTRYIGEVASALVEAKLKMSDINSVLTICSQIYQKYADFSVTFLEHWQKVLLSKKDEKIPNPSKLRVDLRLFADLICVGVLPEKESLNVLSNQLAILTVNDRESHNNLAIIISFCRHCGDDYAGIVSRKFKDLAEKHNLEIPRSQFLRKDRQKACRSLLKDYCSSLLKHVLQDCKELRSTEKHNRKIIQTKGELGAERKEKYETQLQNFQKLLQNASILADLLDETIPELPAEEKSLENDTVGIDIFYPVRGEASDFNDGGLFEDEDTRQFYQSLPDLKSIIPGILYKDSEQVVATTSAETHTDEDLEITEDLMSLPEDSKDLRGEEAKTTSSLLNGGQDTGVELEDDDANVGGSMKVMLDAFLNSLPNCVNRDLVDKAAIEFCMNLNTKMNRRKLAKTLFSVQRTRYDLLPFYSRLVATLHPCMPSLSDELAAMLKGDFRYHVRKKDQINIESKLKSARFIGELTKFGMFSKVEALYCLKTLLCDFSHHNIEMACTFLETCGRFLYRSPDSHFRTKAFLDVMMRKKAAQHLDNRYVTMIENAFYYSNPPENNGKEARATVPPMMEYIKNLLFKDLNKTSVEKVLRQMRKLDWKDLQVKMYAIDCLISIWNVRYNCIHCCANALSGLTLYQEEVCVQVVDSVIEYIRFGMEVNHPKYNQQRLTTCKYLGEMYNYRVIESQVIFSTLYSFITFETSLDPSAPSALDPPEHLFRIRLVYILLESCGHYFDRGSSRKKLDCFLIYFQRYYWFKRSSPVWSDASPFPKEVENIVSDLLEQLRPKLVPFKSWEEANKVAGQLDEDMKNKVYNILAVKSRNASTGLGTIMEMDSEETAGGDDDNMSAAKSNQGSDQDLDGRSQSLSPKDEGESDTASQQDDNNSTLMVEPAVIAHPKLIKCQEDEDFLTAFDKMMAETVQARQQENFKTPAVEIAVPLGVKNPSRARAFQTNKSKESVNGAQDAIPFTVLTKKGNKPQFATLTIPITERFAAKFKEQKKMAMEEKEKMKRVVLEMHERQEEELYQAEVMAQIMKNQQVVPTSTRERKAQCPYTKGVPDADAIFGFKKR